MDCTTIIVAIINNIGLIAPLINSCCRRICQCCGLENDERLLTSKDKNVGQSSRVHMINAKHLDIKHIEDANCWIWASERESGYDEVAVLKNVCALEITATINFSILSPKANYAAYIIFKTKPKSEGLNITQVASVYVNGEQQQPPKSVCLKPTKDTPRDGSIVLPVERDGWMELELGQFKCDNITGDTEAEISIKEINDMTKEKKGLIVAGIEVRPI